WGECVRRQVQDEDEPPSFLTATSEVTQGAFGDFQRGGRRCDLRGQREGRSEVVDVLVSERVDALEALVEARSRLVEVSRGDGDADDQDTRGDGERHSGLAGEGERLAGD